MRLFNKILIANRGEIAVRIIKTAKSLGVGVVTIYHDTESSALHVQQADESYSLGKGDLNDTYLNIDKIINVARLSSCEAIHPGYGFLAENPLFAEACTNNGIVFIGPSASNMRLMGNKIEARNYIESIQVPTTIGVTGSIANLKKSGGDIPFPLLVKAAAGGGGKGMRIVRNKHELDTALESTSREALNYFGDATVFVEQYIESPRHIEIQILADTHGNIIHLFERECSIQRRYQKIVEESPSPTLPETVRQKMAQIAVKIAKGISYTNAGTIEFLVDKNLDFYFLEMNTRIQVEHPVTEMVTGVDIVKEQILIAAGHKISYAQSEIKQKGHAMECRIYAEDPENNFAPSPGNVTLYHEPRQINVRVDASIDAPTTIDDYFDPMISKLIVWGGSRPQCIQHCKQALNSYIVHGIKTNIRFLKNLLGNGDFAANKISTHFCEDNLNTLLRMKHSENNKTKAATTFSAFLLHTFCRKPLTDSIWDYIGYWRDLMELQLKLDNKTFIVAIDKKSHNQISITINNQRYNINNWQIRDYEIIFYLNNHLHKTFVSSINRAKVQVSVSGSTQLVEREDVLVHENYFLDASLTGNNNGNFIYSPMPGKVVRVEVAVGGKVKQGDTLIIIEAMKMENHIKAPKTATIKSINTAVNDKVTVTDPLIELV